MSDGEVHFQATQAKTDIVSFGPGETWGRHPFRIDHRGRLVLHQVPFWAWLALTGLTSSALSVLTVWAVWG